MAEVIATLKTVHLEFCAARKLTKRAGSSLVVSPTVVPRVLSKGAAQVATWVGPEKVAPPKSCGLKPKRKRASPVKVRLNEAEKEIVRRKAAKAEMSVNAFIKCLILGSDYDPQLRDTLYALNLEFTRQGQNLNQIAKHHNKGTITQMEGEALLATIGRSHLHTHKAIRSALALGEPE